MSLRKCLLTMITDCQIMFFHSIYCLYLIFLIILPIGCVCGGLASCSILLFQGILLPCNQIVLMIRYSFNSHIDPNRSPSSIIVTHR